MKSLLCAVVFVLGLVASASAQTTPPPVIERQVIVQASVGRPGREVAFLLVQNLEDEPIDVTVEFLAGAGPSALRTYQLAAKERRAVNVGMEVPELGACAFFSVVVYFPADTAGAAEMVWHRASDFAEVDSQVAMIRRSTKR